MSDLAALLQVLVQLLQSVQVKLLLQLHRLTQVLQHLLREATWEAAADLIDHRALQPNVPLTQQPVTQVVPAETYVSFPGFHRFSSLTGKSTCGKLKPAADPQ